MIKFVSNHIEGLIKFLIFLIGILVVTPLPYFNTSIYFWSVVVLVILFNIYLIFKDYITYFKTYYLHIAFILTCLISSLINYSRYNNIYSIVYVSYTAVLIFGLIPSKNKSDIIARDNKKIEYLIIFYNLILSSYSLLAFIFFRAYFEEGRLLGIYNNPNQAAFWAFASLVFSLKNIKKYKYFHLFNISIQTILIILSGCRSVYIALIIVGFYCLISKNKRHIKNNPLLIFGFISIIFIALLLITLFRYQWLFKYLGQGNLESVINIISSHRYYIWKDALHIFLKRPLFGVGVNNLLQAATYYLGSSSFYVAGLWEDPHNSFVGLLAYTGLVGFSLFYILIYRYLKLAYRVNTLYFISILSILVISYLDIGLIFDYRIISLTFWYLIGNIHMSKGG